MRYLLVLLLTGCSIIDDNLTDGIRMESSGNGCECACYYEKVEGKATKAITR